MVLSISILVEMQLNDVLQLQGLAGHWVLSELLDVWYNVGDIIHSAV